MMFVAGPGDIEPGLQAGMNPPPGFLEGGKFISTQHPIPATSAQHQAPSTQHQASNPESQNGFAPVPELWEGWGGGVTSPLPSLPQGRITHVVKEIDGIVFTARIHSSLCLIQELISNRTEHHPRMMFSCRYMKTTAASNHQ